jgi:Delta24-sterol reductase
MVTVSQATDYLMKQKYALQVCLEIGEATLGGLAMGVGMTTHSHKAGLFQESIVSYDVVLGYGDLVHVTADNEYSDLFYCLPWSHGSLGLLVALELRIIPAEPYIRLCYECFCGSQDNYCARFREVSGAMQPSGDEVIVYSNIHVCVSDHGLYFYH